MAGIRITLKETGQQSIARLWVDKRDEKENPKVMDGYWVNSKGEKTALRPFDDTTLYFYFTTNKEAIGNFISFNIIDANITNYRDSIVYHSFFEIKSIENKVSINIYDIFKDSLYNKKREYKLNFSLYVELSIHKKQTFPNSEKEFLKIYVLEFIPKVMEKQNPRWEIAAKCQKIWFNRDKAQKPHYTKIVTNVVTMNWVKKFSRVLPILNGLKNKMWETPPSINLFCQRLKEMIQNKDLKLPSIDVKNVKKFGSFDNSKYRIDNDGYETTLLDRYYINESVYSTSLINDPLDDLYGALGDFIFRISPKGTIEFYSDETYKITYQKIAVYFIDSFDFVDSKFDIFSPPTYLSQPLGYWDFINNKVSKNIFSNGLYITNESYQKYQNDTGKGEDFRLISDYEEIDINFSFLVKRDPSTGCFNKI